MTTPSSPTEVRRKVESVLHLYCPLGWTAYNMRTATTDVVCIPSRSHDRIERLTRPVDGRRGQGGTIPWRKGPPSAWALPTPCSTPLKIHHWIPRPTCYFQVHRAMNAFLENVLNINTTHWRIPNSLANALKNILSSPIFLHFLWNFGCIRSLEKDDAKNQGS